jgi:Helix-turn-helix of DDE superfamily endonuclease
MRYETVEQLSDEEFKRATGVERSTFQQMEKVVATGLRHFGRPCKLSQRDQILMTLMYWREYRTEFHISLAYGVSESCVCRTIHKIENVLIQSNLFRLPGKKTLQASETTLEIVLLDATEQPIERPKKNSASITAVKRSGIHKRHKSLLS